MGHDISAHWPYKKAAAGYGKAIAFLRYSIGGGAHEFYEVLGASKLDAGVSGAGDGCKMSKAKVAAALDHFCRKRLDGEEVVAELLFFSTILDQWDYRMRSVYLFFG